MTTARACVGVVFLLGHCLLVVGPDHEDSNFPNQQLPAVIIDPGHGGNDEGAKSGRLKEKDATLRIALELEACLQALNFQVKLTRRTDVYLSLAERVQMANDFDTIPPLFVSIHLNTDRARATDGAETFYANEKRTFSGPGWTWVGFFSKTAKDDGDLLAASIQNSIVEALETRDRGIKAKNLYVVRKTLGPAVLVEVGFISNPTQAQLLEKKEYCHRVAVAIAQGIQAYLQKRPPKHSQQAPQLTLN